MEYVPRTAKFDWLNPDIDGIVWGEDPSFWNVDMSYLNQKAMSGSWWYKVQLEAPAIEYVPGDAQLIHSPFTPYVPALHFTHVDDALSYEYPLLHTHISMVFKLVLKDEFEFEGHGAQDNDPELICTL